MPWICSPAAPAVSEPRRDRHTGHLAQQLRHRLRAALFDLSRRDSTATLVLRLSRSSSWRFAETICTASTTGAGVSDSFDGLSRRHSRRRAQHGKARRDHIEGVLAFVERADREAAVTPAFDDALEGAAGLVDDDGACRRRRRRCRRGRRRSSAAFCACAVEAMPTMRNNANTVFMTTSLQDFMELHLRPLAEQVVIHAGQLHRDRMLWG